MRQHILLIVMLVSSLGYAQGKDVREPAAQVIEKAIETGGIEMAIAQFNDFVATEDTSLLGSFPTSLPTA